MKPEQPKRYRCLVDNIYFYYDNGKEYDGNQKALPHLKTVEELAKENPQDWELVTDEPEPFTPVNGTDTTIVAVDNAGNRTTFTPTHIITGGEYINEQVKVICGMSDGRVKAKTLDNEIIYVHIDHILPLFVSSQTSHTTLTEQQYKSLVGAVFMVTNCLMSAVEADAEAQKIVREWAETNNIKLP